MVAGGSTALVCSRQRGIVAIAASRGSSEEPPRKEPTSQVQAKPRPGSTAVECHLVIIPTGAGSGGVLLQAACVLDCTNQLTMVTCCACYFQHSALALQIMCLQAVLYDSAVRSHVCRASGCCTDVHQLISLPCLCCCCCCRHTRSFTQQRHVNRRTTKPCTTAQP
jgi:hypothetical protein